MDIAVVDDERAVREHICGLIKKQKPVSRIKSYATGEELLASGEWFDLVFLDVRMSGMSGIETARRLREKRHEEYVLRHMAAFCRESS